MNTPRNNSSLDIGGMPSALSLYLMDIGRHDVPDPHEERRLCRALLITRNRWIDAFLQAPAAMRLLWSDLQAWDRGEIAAGALVPGPPRLKPGQLGPADHLKRLHRLFARRVEHRGLEVFEDETVVSRLGLAVNFIGMKQPAFARYRLAAVTGDRRRADRVRRARRRFIDARQPLVERNLRMVISVARKFAGGPLTLTELIQEGNLGLLRATDSFSDRFGTRFSTYAFPWIKQFILRALDDKARTIRVPASAATLVRRQAELDDEAGEPREVNATTADIVNKARAAQTVVSLEQSSSDGDDAWPVDALPDEAAEQPVENARRGELSAAVETSLDSLPEREREVISLRFGLRNGRPLTLGEVGRIVKLSAERIRQIQAKALAALRNGPFGDHLAALADV